MAVDLEFGLDAENDVSAFQELRELRRPRVVHVARRALRDLGRVDVEIRQNARLNARILSCICEGESFHDLIICGFHTISFALLVYLFLTLCNTCI